jgi:hypothetical protein
MVAICREARRDFNQPFFAEAFYYHVIAFGRSEMP